MKKALLVSALIVVSSFSLLAQSRHSNALGKSAAPSKLAPASAKHVLKATYLNNAVLGTNASGGFTNIDTQTVVCPGTSGTCTLEVDQAVQLSGAFGRAATCLLVDGNYTDPCFFTGEAYADSGFVTFSQQHQATISAGSHTAVTQQYTDAASFLSEYNVAYRVYKP